MSYSRGEHSNSFTKADGLSIFTDDTHKSGLIWGQSSTQWIWQIGHPILNLMTLWKDGHFSKNSEGWESKRKKGKGKNLLVLGFANMIKY